MWVVADRVFDGERFQPGAAVRVEDARVVEIGTAGADARRVGGTVTPGFVDLQVNGGGGVLLNNDPTPDGVAAIAAAHRGFGTVALMPTVITDAPGVMERASNAVISSDAEDVIGLHIEGPHIAMTKRGTHAAEHIRAFEAATLTCVERLRASGRAVMVTVAPEVVAAAEITALVDAGAVVSLGHTDANAETVEIALNAGATCGTHVFNAMSQMTAREPGAVGALLLSGAFIGLIADGYHVDMRLVRMALNIRPYPDRAFLVSDAMATVGGPETFELYGQTIRVDGGRLVNAEGNLAGAHTTLAEGLRNIVSAGVEPEHALRAVTSIPARAMGVSSLGGLIGRETQDILLLDDSFAVQHTLHDALTA